MKQLLILLSTIALAVPAVGTAAFIGRNTTNENAEIEVYKANNENRNDIKKTKINQQNNQWNDINLISECSVPAAGTHKDDDVKTAQKATAKISWENTISNSRFVDVSGQFDLNTYKEPVNTKNFMLKKIDSESSISRIVFEEEKVNDKWSGWGHQTSKIKIRLIAEYNTDEGITSLMLSNYTYIRTAGSVHKSSTYSKINNLSFLVGYKNK
ncbi:hypothetical protein ESOMN_v1c01250 [Williamsoniiplasma somnilux]|uniref:Uncharacterized protein n=1 Tax=Williamsoniiplasma somnilux TaxID=215578 RepID=A0A2K8NXG2_9MOLU|nr:hypothetical protein [Williamsoniiplasma somnilux]ATZ18510.1 hypothetical protein ESOMN_v1c01250 [Williamsoniiplasma somnilux]